MYVDLYKSYSLCTLKVDEMDSEDVNCNGENWEIEDFVIDGDTELWNNHTWLFSKINYGEEKKCVRFVASSNRTITRLNKKQLLVPVQVYDSGKKRYYSPILCSADLSVVPAQTLDNTD